MHHAYIHLLALLLRGSRGNDTLVAMSLSSVYILVSKYHYPLKRIRTLGERIDSQGREYELENFFVFESKEIQRMMRTCHKT